MKRESKISYFYFIYHTQIEYEPGLRNLLVAKNPDQFGWLVTPLFFFNYESLFALVFVLILVG